ncbi:protein MLP1 homolog [Papilio machaon]|uniref:protein MLP1 homolog n=1 Tax=Papilio machaon TaxID=76193 RepID=UPI001E665243|nr:protein MLP1 homolog [Papilio machaon]
MDIKENKSNEEGNVMKELTKELRVVLTRTPIPVGPQADRRVSESDSDAAASMASAASRVGSLEVLNRDDLGRFWSEGRGQKRPSEVDMAGWSDEERSEASVCIGPRTEKRAQAKAARQRAEEDLAREANIARFRRETRAKLFPEPKQRMEERGAAQLQEQVKEDLEVITKVATKSSNLKGTFVRTLKDAAASIKEAVEVLGARTVTEETRHLQADNARLRAEMASLRKELAELREEMQRGRTQGPAPTATDMTAEAAPTGPSQLEEICRTVMVQVGGMLNARLASFEDRLLPERRLRPPLAADKRNSGRSYAAALSGPAPVSAPMPAPRVQGKAPPAPPAKPGASGLPRQAPGSSTQRPAASAQIRPSQAQARATKGGTSSTPLSEGEKRKKKKKKKKKTKSSPPQGHQQPPQPPQLIEFPWIKVGPKKRPDAKSRARKLQAPQSSAVVLTLQPGAEEKGATYAKVIAAAKEKIDVAEFGGQGVRLRKAANGGRLFEFPGASSGEKADSLAQKLREVLGSEVVRVSRPMKMASLRVTGLDDSVTSAEVVAAVAAAGVCPAEQVRAGGINAGRDGLGSIIVTCPVAAAKKIVEGGRLLVGWVSAQIQLLDARPLMCFKCHERGHTVGQCSVEVDRSALCYRCGQPGHKARECSAALCCAVCTAAGRPADHRAGSRACVSPPKGKKKGGTGSSSQVAGQSSSSPQAVAPVAEEVPMVEG